MCKQSIDRFNEDRARLPSWGPEIDRDVSIYVAGLANWIVGSLHWSFETERYFGKSGHQVKATRTVEILPLRAWTMSKLSLRVCSFSCFLTKLLREVFSGFITPYIYFLEYACHHMLPLTCSSKHSPMTIMLSNCSSFIWLLVFAYLGDSAHRSLVCYLLGLRRQTNPLYTSTTLLDNHHCCAWLFISTLFLCRFCLFWTYVSISSCALICQFTTIIHTAGTGLFTDPENGWEIYWALFKFPKHLRRYKN